MPTSHPSSKPQQQALVDHSGTIHMQIQFFAERDGLAEHTAQNCNVAPFSSLLPTLKDVPIVTAATVVHYKATGEWILLVVNQALWLGEEEDCSLICPNQLRMNGIMCDDIPLHLACFHSGSERVLLLYMASGLMLGQSYHLPWMA
jgi:hypothetical protein